MPISVKNAFSTEFMDISAANAILLRIGRLVQRLHADGVLEACEGSLRDSSMVLERLPVSFRDRH